MKSVYFIPTNRNVQNSIKSYIKEIKYAKKIKGMNIPFIVVETDNKEHVEENRRSLIKIKKNNPDLEIIHLTIDLQKKYFKKLFNGINDNIEEMFLDQSSNYGTAMNKLALFACSLGADTFHRRDSDTCLIFDKFTNLRKVYPIEYELNYLGKKIKDIQEDNLNINGKVNKENLITVVGGNYFGEWNLDVKDFAKKSFDIIYRLYELLGFEKENIKDICDEAFKFDVEFEDIDKLTLVTSVNDGLNPDCGNVGVHKLFEYLPNLPGKNTLAADYFMFDTATALGLPSIHHSRAVFHEYSSERFDLNKKDKYWHGVAKFADYFNLYNEIYNNKNFINESKENKIISENILKNIKDKIITFPKLDKNIRERRITDIAKEILISFGNGYDKIGKNLLLNASNYINEANKDYLNHSDLIKVWQKLISKAKAINLKKILNS